MSTQGRLPIDPETGIRFVALGREPDLVYGAGETPLQCAKCGVELVNLVRALCGACYDAWCRKHGRTPASEDPRRKRAAPGRWQPSRSR